MSKSDEAIREFAVNNGHREYFTDGDMDGFDADPRFVSDLTALISEHYYPKEFVNFVNEYFYWDRGLNGYIPTMLKHQGMIFRTTDELFNYWKENER